MWHGTQDGSIPAWAGKPPAGSRLDRGNGVYPRVGGETAVMSPATIPPRGLSPRGRGNRDWPQVPDVLEGSIPAWAGKPQTVKRCV